MNHGIDTGILVAVAIQEHSLHRQAKLKLAELAANGDRFSLAPDVLSELIHITTDARRFSAPLTVDDAREFALGWWTANEVDQVFTKETATLQFFEWHRDHRLGRKRLFDTMLAATYHAAGVDSILTTNPKDFAVFGCFTCSTP